MKRDPARRKDGKCAAPGCNNPVPIRPPKSMPKSLSAMYMQALLDEPFCSTECCRDWHGTSLAAAKSPRGRRHGFLSTYRAGCRCERCKEACAERGRRRRAAVKEAA